MSNRVEYEIVEEFPDQAPERFGFQFFDVVAPPREGMEFMLKWLDGSDAYRVRVTRVHNYTVFVQALGEVSTPSVV